MKGLNKPHSHICPKCGTDYPLTTEFWYKRPVNEIRKWVLSSCSLCESKRMRKYRFDNRIMLTCQDCHKERWVISGGVTSRPATRWCKSCAAKRHLTRSYWFSGSIIAQWKCNAERRHHNWELTNDDLDEIYERQNGLCALSGEVMVETVGSPWKYSIDRIDSGKNYTPDNVQFVAWCANQAKNDLPQHVFIEMCKMVAEYKK